MTNDQNKAHAVNVGSVYKPNDKSGLICVANDGAIISHFTLKIQARKYLLNTHTTGDTATLSRRESVGFRSKYGNKKTGAGIGGIGYNAISLKNWQYAAPDNGGFVLPSNIGAMRSHLRSCTHTALGVLASGNAPADQFGESTPTLTGGFQSQKLEGIMPKSTSCATAQNSAVQSSRVESDSATKINLLFEASSCGTARVAFEDLDFTTDDLQANRKRIIKALKQACLSARGILDKSLYTPQESPIAYYAGHTIIKPWELGFTLDAVQCTDAVIDSKADAIMQRIAVELNEYQLQVKGGAL